MDRIYKIEGVCVDFGCGSAWYTMFSTFKGDIKEAEEKMVKPYCKLCKDSFDREYIHHIIVTGYNDGQFYYPGDFESKAVYWPDGTLYVKMGRSSSLGEDEFNGRDEGEIPVKAGEKVYWIRESSQEICTGIVLYEPPKTGWNYMSMDSTDDCYTILEGISEIPDDISDELYMNRHVHIPTCDVFKL